jgi:hypothetical protein
MIKKDTKPILFSDVSKPQIEEIGSFSDHY